MPETFQRAGSTAHSPVSAAPGLEPLAALWREGLSIVNLRGDPSDPAFRASVREALGVGLPETAGGIAEGPGLRIVEAGPDDWFVIGAPGEAAASMVALRQALGSLHTAVTDVSSGYTVLRLSGTPARDVLAQGCPLDLHPRAFGTGRCAGSHFFKASVWLWRAPDADAFELLVRRSFAGYVGLMLERTTQECGLVVGSA